MVINLSVECYVNPNIDSNWIIRLFHTLSANSTVYFVNFRQSDYTPILCFTIDYRPYLTLTLSIVHLIIIQLVVHFHQI